MMTLSSKQNTTELGNFDNHILFAETEHNSLVVFTSMWSESTVPHVEHANFLHTRGNFFMPKVTSSCQRALLHARGNFFMPECTSSHQKALLHARGYLCQRLLLHVRVTSSCQRTLLQACQRTLLHTRGHFIPAEEISCLPEDTSSCLPEDTTSFQM